VRGSGVEWSEEGGGGGGGAHSSMCKGGRGQGPKKPEN
jgi:hypothetical protein